MELSAHDVSERDSDKIQRSVRAEAALEQPALPTIFKEIPSRAQTSFSLTGSCETPSPGNHLRGFAALLLLMRCFPGATRDPGLAVGARGRTLQGHKQDFALPGMPHVPLPLQT